MPAPGPIYAYNVHDIVLSNVVLAGTVYDTMIADSRWLTVQASLLSFARDAITK